MATTKKKNTETKTVSEHTYVDTRGRTWRWKEETSKVKDKIDALQPVKGELEDEEGVA